MWLCCSHVQCMCVLCTCIKQGVHAETIYKLDWLNQFNDSSFDDSLISALLIIWNQFRLHVLSATETLYWLVYLLYQSAVLMPGVASSAIRNNRTVDHSQS